MIKILSDIDNGLIKKNIVPMVFCFGAWGIATLFLLRYMELKVPAIITFLLLTFQFISSMYDLYSRTIPIKLMIIALIVGLLIFGLLYKTNALINCVLGGVVAFGVMKLLIVISKRQVGGGDLFLMTVTGFFSGLNSFLNILFISIVLAGVYSLILVFTKKGNRKTEIPFAPFILLATVVLVISGLERL